MPITGGDPNFANFVNGLEERIAKLEKLVGKGDHGVSAAEVKKIATKAAESAVAEQAEEDAKAEQKVADERSSAFSSKFR